jgi:hypothetical protein
MSDEFKKKLAEIASRVEASKQKTSNAAAEKAADVAKVKAVIADWKKRIVPLIVKAVKTANLAATGVHLEVKECHTSVIEADNLGHPMPPPLWGLIVAVSLAIGFLLVFAGLAVVVPVLAHSTWHLYRKVVEPAASG